MGCILSFNINSIKLNTTEYTGTECSKVQYLIALMKQRRKGKRHTHWPGTNVILKYPGGVLLFDPENWFCLALHVRSQCVSYILILHGNTGNFLSVAITTKFCHIQGSLGDRETGSAWYHWHWNLLSGQQTLCIFF